MTKICYDKNLLQDICIRDKCHIDFDKIDKYNREINIDFICNCFVGYSKTFRRLYEGGLFVKYVPKIKEKKKLNKPVLRDMV